MSMRLDFIAKEHMSKALRQIDNEGIQYDEPNVEYYIRHNNRLYPFKHVVATAGNIARPPFTNRSFPSDDVNRTYISSLGFHIVYRANQQEYTPTRYFVSASYYGPKDNLINMYDEFVRDGYWATDHYANSKEGAKVFKLLTTAQINDRICIRYIDKRNGRISIAAIGTVSDTSQAGRGRLEVVWDYNPPKYKGDKPSGRGSGNWWLTLFELKTHEFIETIFGENLVERRVSRLAWNDNGWIMPSGPSGKSKHEDSHEAKYGYGHEEWLFDNSKIINGYHYGFLEPVRKEQDSYLDKTYDVWFYTIYGETKQRFWIGEIKNLIVIDHDEAAEVYDEYVRRGWHEEMEQQIIGAVGNSKGFSKWLGLDLFNVKYRPSDLFVNDPYMELPEEHDIYEQSRYAFGRFRAEYEIVPEESLGGFTFGSGGGSNAGNGGVRRRKYDRRPGSIEITYYHNAISASLTKQLKREYGSDNVIREHPSGFMGNRIDIVVRDRGKYIFYEIKTYNSLRTSVREALGQLLEYCYYPDRCNAKELVIVSHLPADNNAKLYFEHLRRTIKMPIYYQSYNLESGLLSDRV